MINPWLGVGVNLKLLYFKDNRNGSHVGTWQQSALVATANTKLSLARRVTMNYVE